MPYVTVDVDMSDFRDDELIDELEDRVLCEDDKNRLLKILLGDREDLSIDYMQQLINEKALAGPNQLKLDI